MINLHLLIVLLAVQLPFGYSQKKSCTFSTDEGRCCVLPFVYNNRTYTECTADNMDEENWRRQWNTGPWCPGQDVQQGQRHLKCFRTEHSCGGVRTASAGVISSSNFPRRITNNSHCVWTIKVPQSNRISLNFTHFNLSTDCASAYLNIYDGENTTHPLLRRLCGIVMPPPIVSTSNTMTLLFRSMTSEEGKGFRAYYDTGECHVRTWGGNGGGACCVFPFIYKGEVYNNCITKDAEQTSNKDPWCAVTSNYDRDRRRGLCVLEHVPCAPRQSECTNNHWWKQCIDTSKKCDGPVDCADGSDEEGCPPMNNPYKCSSVYLVSNSLVWKLGRKCAYKDYCGNTTFGAGPCNISSWNKCNNGRCIPPEWVCDGKDDCGDKSDEIQPQCPYKAELADSKACGWVSDCRKWERQLGKGPLTRIQNMFTCKYSNTTIIPQYLPHTTTTLNIVKKKLRKLGPSSFARYDKLERLRLQKNQISNISPYTFSNLYNLVDLNLDDNNLTIIVSNTFEGLSSLRQLRLQGNPIEIIQEDGFFGLSRVESLNLTNLKLKRIELGAFRGMHSLSKLYIEGNNKLTTLHIKIFDDVNLNYLSADRFEFCCIAKLAGENCSAPKDLFSSCEDLMANPTLKISIWILGCIALLGNTFVLIWRLKSKSESKVHSLLLLNLAISDFLMGIYLVMIGSVDLYYRGKYSIFSEDWKRSSLCQFCGFLSTLSSEASVFILTIMTADRFVAITYPLRNISLKLCGAYKALALIWLSAFILASIPLMGIEYFNDFYARSGVCLPLHLTAEKPAGWQYSVFVFLVLNLISFLAIFVLYLLMFIKIRQTNTMTGVSQKAPTTSIGSRMVFIVLTDFVCWIPIIIIGIASLLGMKASPVVYAWVAVFVLPLNSALNPVLYTISTTNFRRNINTTVRKGSKKQHGMSFMTATENQTMITTPRKLDSVVEKSEVINGRKVNRFDDNRNNDSSAPMLSLPMLSLPVKDTKV